MRWRSAKVVKIRAECDSDTKPLIVSDSLNHR